MRLSMPDLGLNEVCLQKPLSMTYMMPSIVSEVSAMFVAKITLRAPSGVGVKILAYMSEGKVE